MSEPARKSDWLGSLRREFSWQDEARGSTPLFRHGPSPEPKKRGFTLHFAQLSSLQSTLGIARTALMTGKEAILLFILPNKLHGGVGV